MSAPLRVGIDGRAFDSPAPGVRRYVHELTRALRALGAPLTLVALGGRPQSAPALEHVPEPWHPPKNLGWSMFGVMRAARQARVDVYHAPAYTAPPFGVPRQVVTLHDVSYERRPEWYPHRRDRWRRAFYRASARAATIVITDSEFSRDEIVAAYGLPPARVRVIPLGVAPGFTPASSDAAAPAGVRTPFVLHVGDIHTRRNLCTALDAVLLLRRRGGVLADLSLVLVGSDRGSLQELLQRAAAGGASAALQVLGSVDESVLVALYRSAIALVYPSRYEGFGLPLVEAMATGTPVLAAAAPTSAEVTGGAAWLLPADGVREWTAAIAAVAEQSPRSQELRAAGLRRAMAFSWQRTAAATYEVYRECAAS